MAIRANRDKVMHGINLMIFAGDMQRNNMMNLDDSRKGRPIGMRKIEATYGARSSMSRYTCLPRRLTSLIAIKRDLTTRSFPKLRLSGVARVTTQ